MIEMRHLKNVVILNQRNLSLMLSRKVINIYNDIARIYGNVTVKDFRKYEELEQKYNKLNLAIDFLSNWKRLGVYPNFLTFKLWNFSAIGAVLLICKILLQRAINKLKKELQHLLKELTLSKNFLSTQLSTNDFYIITKSLVSNNKKSLQKSLYTQERKLSSLTRDCNLPIFTAKETITNLCNMNYPRKNLIYLKQVDIFQSNQKKFQNPKSSLLLKRIIVHFLTTLNPRKRNSDESASFVPC